ncbi:glyoxalase family protein [Leptospira broomii serovar Hurstbridge str. 5399]|uniref:Glyoxalase family protein n=1 Tax=Leptospira broomii serovar Hurstbridge str. 5399 TaxID=1049789 RepID=T0GN92_9LEPT|nr:VOC family protein [Leptospira broomii]EQA46808.1 glyoxalase family protein [Leptospira broomii serovar Hurstbridge str. 5399]
MNKPASKIPVQAHTPVSKVQDIAYVRLGRKNLSESERYYTDFGLRVLSKTKTQILFHGNSSNFPCWSIEESNRDFLLGLGFHITSYKEFEALKKVKGAQLLPLGRFGNLPCVTLLDPSGLPVDVVLSEVPKFTSQSPKKRDWNRYDSIKRVNRPQAAETGPPGIIRLGHAVFLKQEFLKNAQWYCDTFGMIPSDIQLLPKLKEPVLVFLRCNRGKTLADHHSIVIGAGADDRLEHCAFELKDIDEISQGRQWLLSRGWKAAWGIGRHILGSQVFDYERDPTGMLVEHYTDGDKFDDTYPVGFHEISRKSLYQWGEDMPKDFLDSRLSFHVLKELIKGILSGREIRFGTLIGMKAMAEKPPRHWIKY